LGCLEKQIKGAESLEGEGGKRKKRCREKG
jgi:hypothetical protein